MTIGVTLAGLILASAAPLQVLAWTQEANQFPDEPDSCDNSLGNICVRWPKTTSNLSWNVRVNIGDPSLAGANVDLAANVRDVVIPRWNGIAARNPHLIACTGGTECWGDNVILVRRISTLRDGTYASFGGQQRPSGQTADWRGRDYFTSGIISLNTAVTWNYNLTCDWPNCDSRATISHEMGHAEGLGHTSFTSVMGPGVQYNPMTNDRQGIIAIYGAYP